MKALAQPGEPAASESQRRSEALAGERPATQTIRPVEDGGGAGIRQGPQRAVAAGAAASGKLSYNQWLQQELGAVIDETDLSALQKRCLRSRWLDAVMWMEGKCQQSQRRYYALRLVIIIGGVIIPTLVSLNLGGTAAEYVRWATFALSLMVAISAAVEGFFRYGERWRHYRPIVERLKMEGWQFFQLSGPYAQAGTHRAAYPEFAARVEAIIQSDVETYITEIVREKQEKQEPVGEAGTS
jgi:hypothetical protein